MRKYLHFQSASRHYTTLVAVMVMVTVMDGESNTKVMQREYPYFPWPLTTVAIEMGSNFSLYF